MASTTTVACLLALFLASAVQQGEASRLRNLLCTVKASSTSRASGGRVNVVKERTVDLFRDVKGCRDACVKADASITVIAEAIALATVDTFVSVGSGCSGSSFGNASGRSRSSAVATASGFAEAVATVTRGNELATSRANAGAFETVIRKAEAEASSSVRGQGFASSNAVARNVARAVVELIVEAIAIVEGCGNSYKCG